LRKVIAGSSRLVFPNCRVRINTMSEFLDHLANDAMPALLERLVNKEMR
jgi:hypothetical protein